MSGRSISAEAGRVFCDLRSAFRVFPLRERMVCLLRAALGATLLVSLAACSGAEERGAEPALPYSVFLYAAGEPTGTTATRARDASASGSSAIATAADADDAEALDGDEDAAESMRAGVRYRRETESLLEWLARDLVERGLVARAEVVDAADTASALAAARNAELLVGVRVQTPAVFDRPRVHGGWATLEVITWLFGGVPAWFVPSLRYETGTKVDLAIHDMNTPAVQGWLGTLPETPSRARPPEAQLRFEAAAGEQGSSLFHRADFGEDLAEYALTIVIPPMFLEPGNIDRSSRMLTAEIDRSISEQLENGLKSALLANENAQPLRIVFDDPAFDRSSSEALFRFVSRTRSPLVAFDVNVRALDPSGAIRGDVEAWRYLADRAELERLNREIASRGEVAIARAVSLRPGANLITVRARDADGARVSRTLVIGDRAPAAETESIAARPQLEPRPSLALRSLLAASSSSDSSLAESRP